MKGIVFAAGVGSRLKPFTDTHPKALAPVGADTALGFVIRRLVDAGADGVVVNVHHFAAQVTDWLAARDFGVPVEISDESPLLLDTGGALAKIYRESRIVASAAPDEPLIVHNADILTDFSLTALTQALADADAAVLVDAERASSRALLFDSDGRMRGWENVRDGIVRPEGIDPASFTPAAFGGVHAMRRGILADISAYCGTALHPFGIVPYYIDRCADLCIRACMPPKPYRWHDIGTPERLLMAQKTFSSTPS